MKDSAETEAWSSTEPLQIENVTCLEVCRPPSRRRPLERIGWVIQTQDDQWAAVSTLPTPNGDSLVGLYRKPPEAVAALLANELD